MNGTPLVSLLTVAEAVTFSSLSRGFGAQEQDSGGNFTHVYFGSAVSQVSVLPSGAQGEGRKKIRRWEGNDGENSDGAQC